MGPLFVYPPRPWFGHVSFDVLSIRQGRLVETIKKYVVSDMENGIGLYTSNTLKMRKIDNLYEPDVGEC